MKTKRILLATAVLVLLAGLPGAVKADPVTLTLPSSVNVAQGGSITVIGTISNGGAPDFHISSWSIVLSNPGLTFDDSAFFLSPLVLGSGASYGPTGFFDVFADITLAPGIYSGTFTVFDLDRQIDVTQTFAINVSEVPEPVSVLLLGSGLGGLLIRRRRKQRNAH